MSRKPKNVVLDNRILESLTDGPLLTPQLADLLNIENKRIYRRCRWLEENGDLQSYRGQFRGLYCIDDEQIVTEDIYQDCLDNEHELRSMSSRIWELVT